jgi:hypothetical protein
MILSPSQHNGFTTRGRWERKERKLFFEPFIVVGIGLTEPIATRMNILTVHRLQDVRSQSSPGCDAQIRDTMTQTSETW